jgi:hypothetical protein
MKLLVRNVDEIDSDFFQHLENFFDGRNPIMGVGLAKYDAASAIHH